MEWVNKYLSCSYEDGARGPDKHDCWSLVRTVRHAELGCRLLAEYGSLRNTDPREFTRAYEEESAVMEKCEPEPGAIASVLIGRICVHVALVIDSADGLRILEINPTRGARCLPLHKWLRDHSTVTFHRDRP
ncbi:hypothetical protein D3C81_1140080 [compost metagenome]